MNLYNLVLSTAAVAILSINVHAAKSKTSVSEISSLKNWTFGFTSENYYSGADASDVSSDNIFSVSYRLSDVQSLSMMMPYSTKINDSESGFTRQDLQLQYAQKHGKFAGGLGLASKYRLYMPTSVASEDLGRWQLRLYGTATKVISPQWKLSVTTNPRAYAHTKHEEGQLALKWVNKAKISFAPNSVWGMYTSLGHIHYNRNTGTPYAPKTALMELEDPYDNDDALNFQIGTSVSYNGVSLILWAEQERDLRNPENSSLFDENETMYFTVLDISI